jgi:hypothetical protein
VVPVRLRQSRQPWKAVVSYVKRVKFFLDFIMCVIILVANVQSVNTINM